MVSDKIVVETRAFGADTAYRWTSEGADGYTIEPCEKSAAGTEITLYIKEDTEEDVDSKLIIVHTRWHSDDLQGFLPGQFFLRKAE